MANTSGSSAFNLDLTDLVEEAFERAGGELRTGYDLRTARRSLNIMFADWANRGINMWSIEPGTITFVQGQNTYALPSDTIDLLEHVIRTGANSTSTQADLTITRISVSTYATIPNKIQQARPIQIWIQRYNAQSSPTGLTLNGTITATATTLTLSSTVGLPASGFIKIDSEIINYSYISDHLLLVLTVPIRITALKTITKSLGLRQRFCVLAVVQGNHVGLTLHKCNRLYQRAVQEHRVVVIAQPRCSCCNNRSRIVEVMQLYVIPSIRCWAEDK